MTALLITLWLACVAVAYAIWWTFSSMDKDLEGY